MRFSKYLGKTFLWALSIGAGTGLGSAAGVLLVFRADEALKKNAKLKAEVIENEDKKDVK